MSTHPVPLARLSLVSSRGDRERRRSGGVLGRIVLWGGGLLIAAAIGFGVPAYWKQAHPIASSGGRYFLNRLELPVPPFQQGDNRWGYDLLGPTYETLSESGCALTSAAMVLHAYGVDTDPHRLNAWLTTNGGFTPQGWLYWEKAAAVAPYSQVQKAYEDPPSYALIDENLLAGNPVIVRLTLRSGRTHFVVIVGKDGWDYLIRDPARSPDYGVYPLKKLTSTIEALRFYRVVAPIIPPPAPIIIPPVTPQPIPLPALPAAAPASPSPS